jgi:hypothetical protein
MAFIIFCVYICIRSAKQVCVPLPKQIVIENYQNIPNIGMILPTVREKINIKTDFYKETQKKNKFHYGGEMTCLCVSCM